MSNLITSIQHNTREVLASEKGKNFKNLDLKRRNKTVLIHKHHDCLPPRTPPATKKFSKVIAYKVNKQKLIIFLYISNSQMENKTKTEYHLQ